MKLRDAREFYNQRSTKLSDVVRQLYFAGIAVIWLLRTGDKAGGIPFNESLLWPLGLLVTAATFDLLHYAYASAAWGIFHRKKEKAIKHDQDKEFRAPASINHLTLFFFWGKTVLTVIAYFFLVSYIAHYLVSYPPTVKTG